MEHQLSENKPVKKPFAFNLILVILFAGTFVALMVMWSKLNTAMELAEKDGIDFFSYVAEEKKTTPSDRSTPNLREVVENKKRSGSFMEVGAGTARPKVGAKEIASATLDELMSMKPEDFARARKEAAEMAKRGEVLRA